MHEKSPPLAPHTLPLSLRIILYMRTTSIMLVEWTSRVFSRHVFKCFKYVCDDEKPWNTPPFRNRANFLYLSVCFFANCSTSRSVSNVDLLCYLLRFTYITNEMPPPNLYLLIVFTPCPNFVINVYDFYYCFASLYTIRRLMMTSSTQKMSVSWTYLVSVDIVYLLMTYYKL